MFNRKKTEEKKRKEAMEKFIGHTHTFTGGDQVISLTPKKKEIHAKCALCGVTDFRDNMVEVTTNLATEGRLRGYEVDAESYYQIGGMHSYTRGDHVHAKCMDITKSDDEAGWNFKKKRIEVKEEK